MTVRRIAALVLFDLAAVLIVAGLAWLCAWQIDRRAWKLDLIARVDARVNAAPAPAPGRDRWADVSASRDEYRRVTMSGRWPAEKPALIQASTRLGGGYWVLAPFARDDGSTVVVNRGFVPVEERDPAGWRPSPAGPTTVTGLLRLTEPGGGFLRANDPGADRWFSRDVAAIASSRGLKDVAPYFIDAERPPGETGWPAAGLTVVAFSNNHLVYAFTWGALALMAAAATVFVNVEVLRESARRVS